jgi:hypothetical protein
MDETYESHRYVSNLCDQRGTHRLLQLGSEVADKVVNLGLGRHVCGI